MIDTNQISYPNFFNMASLDLILRVISGVLLVSVIILICVVCFDDCINPPRVRRTNMPVPVHPNPPQPPIVGNLISGPLPELHESQERQAEFIV